MTTSPFDADRPPEPAGRRGGRHRGGRGQRGGRRDESILVPDATFSSYYGRNIVKPAPWGHEIPAYFFLGGVAAGSGLIAAGAHASGLQTLRRNSRYAALGAVGLSGVALVADLGRPERFLNMMRTVKLTSPMSVGTWIFSGFAACAGLAALSEAAGALGVGEPTRRPTVLARPRRRGVAALVGMSGLGGVGGLGGVAPSRPQRMAALARRFAEPLSSVGSAFFAPPLAAYTAALVAATATPMWREGYRELPFVFCGSAISAAGGLAMVTTPTAGLGPVPALSALGAGVELVAHRQMTRRLDEIGGLAEPLETGRVGRLARAATSLTAAGAVGGLVAAALGAGALGAGAHRLGRPGPRATAARALAVVSGVALLAGSAATRFSIVEGGIESAKDPKYTVAAQRRSLARKQAAGEDTTSVTTASPTPDTRRPS